VRARQTLVADIRASLLADFQSGRFAPGDKIPNETILASQFGVSRATLREAIQGLIEGGYVARQHGLGTFVTGVPRHRHALDMTVSYTAMIEAAGLTPSVTVLSRSERPARPNEAFRLGLTSGAPLVCVERVRAANRLPIIYSD